MESLLAPLAVIVVGVVCSFERVVRWQVRFYNSWLAWIFDFWGKLGWGFWATGRADWDGEFMRMFAWLQVLVGILWFLAAVVILLTP